MKRANASLLDLRTRAFRSHYRVLEKLGGGGMGGTNGCKCAYDKNLSVGYETVVAINDGGRAAIKSANSFPVHQAATRLVTTFPESA